MSYWGKLLGSVAGFAVAGPFGAVVGAALGHAADAGNLPRPNISFGSGSPFGSARIAALLGRKDQLFAISVVVLSAKLAKADGPVNRLEIDSFKRNFRIPPASVRDIGRLFDQARDSTEGFEGYAQQLGEAFADTRGVLADCRPEIQLQCVGDVSSKFFVQRRQSARILIGEAPGIAKIAGLNGPRLRWLLGFHALPPSLAESHNSRFRV